MSASLSYKNAFKCKKCPQSNQENGCPAWLEIVMTNDQGSQKMERGCSYQLMPMMLIETMRSADHTTAAAYDMRNKVVSAVQRLTIPLSPSTQEIEHE